MISIKSKLDGALFKRKSRAIFEGEMRRGILESVTLVESTVAENTPVGATGILRAGVRGYVIDHALGVVTVVGPASKYAEVREVGRKPGKMPPSDALVLWVKRKLRVANPKRVAFLVARKIGRKGYPGAFMFKKAERQTRRRVMIILEKAVDRIERRLSDRS